MTGRLLAAALAAALALPPAHPGGAPGDTEGLRPPARYRSVPAEARVRFVAASAVQGECEAANGRVPPPGYVVAACTLHGDQLVLPDPCAAAGADDYARLVCHELAHSEGWAPTHPVEGPPWPRLRAAG